LFVLLFRAAPAAPEFYWEIGETSRLELCKYIHISQFMLLTQQHQAEEERVKERGAKFKGKRRPENIPSRFSTQASSNKILGAPLFSTFLSRHVSFKAHHT